MEKIVLELRYLQENPAGGWTSMSVLHRWTGSSHASDALLEISV